MRVVGQFAAERSAGETFADWLDRAGGAAGVGTTLKDLDDFPTPDEAPDFYVDFDETGPYVAEVGDSECADVTDIDSASDHRLRVTGRSPTSRELADGRRPTLEQASPRRPRSSGRGSASATDLVLAASFQDCVLIDVALQVAPDIEVVFLDTQYHFAETLWYVEQVRERYDLNLTVMRPEVAARRPAGRTIPTSCCALRKVEPLDRALAGKAAWMTGLRRDEAVDPGQGADRRPTTSAAAS